MRLEEALKLFPPEGVFNVLDQETYERQRQAGQVIADSLRKLMAEQIAILRELAQLRANAVEGQEYSLIRNADMNGVTRMVHSLYLRPIAPIRPLPDPARQ